jgi:hypothetical protein
MHFLFLSLLIYPKITCPFLLNLPRAYRARVMLVKRKIYDLRAKLACSILHVAILKRRDAA